MDIAKFLMFVSAQIIVLPVLISALFNYNSDFSINTRIFSCGLWLFLSALIYMIYKDWIQPEKEENFP